MPLRCGGEQSIPRQGVIISVEIGHIAPLTPRAKVCENIGELNNGHIRFDSGQRAPF